MKAPSERFGTPVWKGGSFGTRSEPYQFGTLDLWTCALKCDTVKWGHQVTLNAKSAASNPVIEAANGISILDVGELNI